MCSEAKSTVLQGTARNLPKSEDSGLTGLLIAALKANLEWTDRISSFLQQIYTASQNPWQNPYIQAAIPNLEPCTLQVEKWMLPSFCSKAPQLKEIISPPLVLYLLVYVFKYILVYICV